MPLTDVAAVLEQEASAVRAASRSCVAWTTVTPSATSAVSRAVGRRRRTLTPPPTPVPSPPRPSGCGGEGTPHVPPHGGSGSTPRRSGRPDRTGPNTSSPAHGITVGTVVPAAQCHVAAVMERCAESQTGRLVPRLRVDEVHLAVAAPGDGDPVGAR